MTDVSLAAQPSTREVTLTRIFDAPRALVWKVWTEPESVRKWWAPKAFTAPVARIDFRVGGSFLFCMRSEDGQEIWNTGVYREIVDGERIVSTNCFSDPEGKVVPATHYGMSSDIDLEMILTVTFEDHEGKTRLTVRHAGLPAGEISEGAVVGWNESLDKFVECLK